jgi:hypothetical protein
VVIFSVIPGHAEVKGLMGPDKTRKPSSLQPKADLDNIDYGKGRLFFSLKPLKAQKNLSTSGTLLFSGLRKSVTWK